ncbi:MAG TPA: ACT domain-containing protein, partial [Bacillota bacterium]|nr:ACT domain-containing protein [Bacillota bacterium]
IDAARTMRSRIKDGIMETTFAPASVLPVSRLVSRFYLRLQAQDRPGVFAALATAFGEEQVSLDMIIQKRSEAGTAEIVLVTHDVIEERFNRAMQRIEACEAIETVNSVFRVLE